MIRWRAPSGANAATIVLPRAPETWEPVIRVQFNWTPEPAIPGASVLACLAGEPGLVVLGQALFHAERVQLALEAGEQPSLVLWKAWDRKGWRPIVLAREVWQFEGQTWELKSLVNNLVFYCYQ